MHRRWANLWSQNTLAQGIRSSSEDVSFMDVFLCLVGERAGGERKQVGVRDLTLMLIFLRLCTNQAQKYAERENVPDRETSKGTIKAEGGLITTYSHLYVNS